MTVPGHEREGSSPPSRRRARRRHGGHVPHARARRRRCSTSPRSASARSSARASSSSSARRSATPDRRSSSRSSSPASPARSPRCSFAELASTIPVAGSAYTYSYATMGELVAWIIGWDLILEYGVSVAAVAVGWGGYFNELLDPPFGFTLPESIAGPPARAGWSTCPRCSSCSPSPRCCATASARARAPTRSWSSSRSRSGAVPRARRHGVHDGPLHAVHPEGARRGRDRGVA